MRVKTAQTVSFKAAEVLKQGQSDILRGSACAVKSVEVKFPNRVSIGVGLTKRWGPRGSLTL